MSQQFYFEPPSRMQLADKMAHLLRYSDFLIVIAGPEGSGKSSVTQRLALVARTPDIHQIIVTLEGETDALQLARQCAKLVSDEYADGLDPLTILHNQSRALHDVGQHLLIVIDNAEWLNDEAVELLAGLLVSGTGKPKIVLCGEDSLVSRLTSLSLYELLEGRLHLERLNPFTEDEAKEFLSLRFSAQQDLNKQELRSIYSVSGGYPGRLTSAASELYRSGRVVARASILPLPIPHIVGISLVLLGVLSVSLWKVLQDDNTLVEPQVVDGRVSVPLNVSVDPTVESDSRSESINEMQSALSKLLADQEQVLRKESVLEGRASVENQPDVDRVVLAMPVLSAETKEEVIESPALINDATPVIVEEDVVAFNKVEPDVVPEPKRVVADKAEIKAVTQPEIVAPPKQVVVAPVKAAPVKAAPVKTASAKVTTGSQPDASQWLKEDQLLTWPSSGYTLQVLGARSEESIVRFMTSLSSRDKLYYFNTLYKNGPWHVVVYGQYANRAAANRAINSLPPDLKKLKPWARSIGGVQQDIKKK
ncbi:AAA family ATPase [Neptunomonas antarctica]|uniref:Sporulation related domain-containing protein n=1 Tax=Neptunomonas antarctica TaxID=619304 RepID=A0A1N7J359_9GAMM|nr:AAA family ATPase [Neptunomonas antarctica]SIS43780.1 Sporulation related domain-containing protein [Neptunomonas antarctica]